LEKESNDEIRDSKMTNEESNSGKYGVVRELFWKGRSREAVFNGHLNNNCNRIYSEEY
jgi:hypothetical protein